MLQCRNPATPQQMVQGRCNIDTGPEAQGAASSGPGNLMPAVPAV